jgi:uncharacterized protein (TIGR03905 family)
MRHSYKTKDTCSSKITFDLDDGIVRNIEFTGGCNGNLKVIQKLVDGFTAEHITTQLGGVLCGRRPTSCGDQLAKAVQKARSQKQRENGQIL